ncbi:hypothetical protein VE04_02062 [Pseudogymnoascus sp. 24MN13]|nr:hypothetical protein VE04_02062 [Pseudogymnoascus sp. 24MN13]
MADADLEEIRKARLAQLKSQGGGGGGASNPKVGEGEGQAAQAAAVKMTRDSNKNVPDARQSILNQILEPAAAERLGRIRLVKASRADDVENRLITLARSGQLRQKVTEEQLKDLLNAVAETKEEEKIVISRRKGGWDDDDDDLFNM